MTETIKKNLILRRIWLAVSLLLLSVLQNTDGFFPQIFGVRALLLIPAVTCISMFERDISGMFFGLFAGALWDVFTFGGDYNAIFLLAVGFSVGTLINTIMRSNVVTAFLLSFINSMLYSVGYWLIHFVLFKADNAVYMLLRYYLPGAVYTAALAPLMFIAVRAIEKKYEEE